MRSLEMRPILQKMSLRREGVLYDKSKNKAEKVDKKCQKT